MAGYFAANAVPVQQAWTAQSKFPTQDAWQDGYKRLDVFANGTDVIVQFLTDDDAAVGLAFQDDRSQEVLCPMGFHSIPMESARFIAVRFKVWEQTLLPATGTVHFRCFP